MAELGELEGPDALRDRLARAMGDPDLVVGYRLGRDGVYVDATGQILESSLRPRDGPRPRSVTPAR